MYYNNYFICLQENTKMAQHFDFNSDAALGPKMNWQNDIQADDVKDEKENWEWDETQFKWVLGGDDVDSEKSWPNEDTRIVIDKMALLGPGIQSLTESKEYSRRIATFNVPLYGRIQFVKHKPGYIHLSIIVLYWLYGNWSTFTYLLNPQRKTVQISPIYFWGKCNY